MKIGLIGDTHGNLWGWERAWELVLKDADIIVHCGDVLYHGPKFKPAAAYDPKALAEAINSVDKPVLIARGNGDSEVDQLELDMPSQQPYLFAQIEGTRLWATHGHLMKPEDCGELCRKWGVQYLLTGHTHVPAVNRHEGYVHINPGTTTYPLDPDESKRRPTCGYILDGEVRLVDIGTGEEL